MPPPISFPGAAVAPPSGLQLSDHEINTGLFAAYLLTQGGGRRLEDFSGNGRWMTSVGTNGAGAWVAGPEGFGSFVNGNTGHAFNTASLTFPSGDLTIAAWGAGGSSNATKSLCSIGGATGGCGFKTNASSQMQFSLNNTSVVDTSFTLDQTPHFWCGTHKGSTITHYRDGVSRGTASQGGLAITNSLYIGDDVSGTVWNGWVSQVQYWTRALTPDEVQALYLNRFLSLAVPMNRQLWFFHALSAALAINAYGIQAQEVFGADALGMNLGATGLAAQEVFGSDALGMNLGAAGLTSLEVFGADALSQNVGAAGLAAAETFGAPGIAMSLNISGIGANEIFGADAVAISVQQVLISGGVRGAGGDGAIVLAAGDGGVRTTGTDSIQRGAF